LYQYDTWYMSLYVGDRLVCRFGWNCHIDTIDTINSPDDEHMIARNM